MGGALAIRPWRTATGQDAASAGADAAAGTNPATAWTDSAAPPASGYRSADAAGLRTGRAAARRGRRTAVHEQPLVVALYTSRCGRRRLHPWPGARIDADGGLAALADHAVQSPAPATGALERGRCRGGGLRAGPRAARYARLRIDADEQRLELAVLGHGIGVLLTQKLLLHEHVDIRGPRARTVAAFPEADRAHILLAAKDQLRLLLAPGLVPPGGKRSAHQDGHDGEGDEEGRHGIALLRVLTP